MLPDAGLRQWPMAADDADPGGDPAAAAAASASGWASWLAEDLNAWWLACLMVSSPLLLGLRPCRALLIAVAAWAHTVAILAVHLGLLRADRYLHEQQCAEYQHLRRRVAP